MENPTRQTRMENHTRSSACEWRTRAQTLHEHANMQATCISSMQTCKQYADACCMLLCMLLEQMAHTSTDFAQATCILLVLLHASCLCNTSKMHVACVAKMHRSNMHLAHVACIFILIPPALRSRFSKPETRNLKPQHASCLHAHLSCVCKLFDLDSRNPKPETRNPKPETRNLKL